MAGIFSAVSRRIYAPKSEAFKAYQQLVSGKTGLEIGGPSPIFGRRGLLPIYPIVGHLDNCNFGYSTIWEGRLIEGLNFRYDTSHSPGYQYIREATDLVSIPSGFYDFMLSSHAIEHTANPLKALEEWKRVLKDDGFIILVVPHKDGTFDRKRPLTTLDHLVQDYQCSTGEDDLTHLPEILKLHDFEADHEAGSVDEFKRRSERNHENRCLHQHVFNTELLLAVTNYMGLQIWAVESTMPCHIILIAQKLSLNQAPKNQIFMDQGASYHLQSPFPSDKST